MNKLPNLNDKELHGTLINALHVAADVYRNNAKTIREDIDARKLPGAMYGPLAVQFDRQASECGHLAGKLEEHSEEI